jgi:uncharacterized membrane protein
MKNAISVDMGDNTKEVLISTAESLKEGLEVAAQKMGVAAEAVWPILVTKAWLEGLTSLLLCGVGFCCFLIMLYVAYKSYKASETIGKSGEDPAEVVCAVSLCLGALTFLVMIVGIMMESGEAISRLIVPEYWAVMDLGDIINKLKR